MVESFSDMIVYKTAVMLSNPGDNKIYYADTIEYEGKLWLVPTWLESPSLSYKLPERIVCIETLAHMKAGMPGVDYVLNNPIPRDVLYGQILPELKEKYVVKMRPDIRVSIPTIH